MPVEPELARRLAALGPVDVATLFELASVDPATGSYQRDPGAVFGAGGDFVTAPEISQTFGELLGLTLADAWQRAGGSNPAALVELGPGRGTLLADAWRAVRRLDGLQRAWSVHLVERSQRLRDLQARTLAELRPAWHAGLETLPADRPWFCIANEFLDALPVHQLERTAADWAERRVAVDDAGVAAWHLAPAPAALAAAVAQRFPDAAPGAVVEWAPARIAVVAAVAQRIVERGGLALFVDYGGVATAPRDTLQAVSRHRSVPVLDHLGAADLSSAVDFAPLAAAATAVGAAAFGPVPQARVLRDLGIELRALKLVERRRGEARADVLAGVRRLLDPRAMGEAFKVLAIAPAGAGVPAGFVAEDRWPTDRGGEDRP